MLDSSSFDSNSYAQEYCKNKRLKLLGKAEFPIGWLGIFEMFIDSVEKYKIFIEKIEYEYEQIDMYIDLRNTTRAAEILRAVEKCRYDSRRICAGCGGIKGSKTSINKMYCSKCLSDQSVEKKTGTWLDRY